MVKMKILMLLSNPFMVDPRVSREAKSLVDYGHEVTVIVWDRKGDYRSEDIIDGIRIIRIHNNLIMEILPNDLLRNPLWWRKAYKKGLELYKTGQFKFDVVHCHDLDTLQSGVWLKKKLGIKLIYDAHEIFGYMVQRDHSSLVSKSAFLLEKKLVGMTDEIITAETTYNEYFKTIGCSKITSILNCKDIHSKEYKSPSNDIFTLVYIGILSKSRFFPEVIDVIKTLKDVKLVIAGKKENMYEQIEEYCKMYDNVDFLGPIPFDAVIPNTKKADVVICMINPRDINNKIATANKQFEAMVCGRPIICTKGTRSGELTEKERCGLTIDYDKDALRDAIIKLRDDPELCEEFGRNALKAAKEKYNWKIQEEKLIKVYEVFLSMEKDFNTK